MAKDKNKEAMGQPGGIQGPLAGWTPNISMSNVFGAISDAQSGPEREEVIHAASGDATTAYANHNDYYIYFYYIPSGGIVGKKENFIKFKAILTDFDDMYISAWKEEDIYGRMDPVATFQSTKRQINFSFDVVAGDLTEAIDNYNKSKALLSYLYPVYEAASTAGINLTSIKAPPLLKIKFANLINEKVGNATLPLVGKLDGLSYRPTLDVGFFESQKKVYPKVNSFACNFTVLHTQEPVLSATGLGPMLSSPPQGTTRSTDDMAPESNLEGDHINNNNDAIQAQLNAAKNKINEDDIFRRVENNNV